MAARKQPEAEVVVEETAAPVEAEETTPEVETEQAPADDATGEGDVDGEEGEAAARAAALARLVNPEAHEAEGDGDTLGGGESVPVLPEQTGVVLEWGGDVPHLVVSVLFQHRVDGLTQTAYKGDVVNVDPATVTHGVRDGNLVAAGLTTTP